jgi:DNA-binding NarL/FixJ family response regulator
VTQAECQNPRPIRVAAADDTYLVREALERILSGLEGLELVAVCEDRDSLMDVVRRERLDAVLTDIRMPPGGTDEGIQIARELRVTNPNLGVVVLSQFADPAYVIALLESGSEGRAYLLKERIAAPGELRAAIETVVAGGSFVDPKVVEALVNAGELAATSPLAVLTPRELEVLAQVAEGKSNAAIAESLVLTKRAVEKHINAIFMKLDLRNSEDVSRRVKAALMFLSTGARPAE